MKLRTIIVTVAILAALSLVAYLGNRPKPAAAADPRIGGVLLDSDTAAKAAGLVVQDQGKKVELTRSPSGQWTVLSYYNFPADVDKISRLAQDLHEAKIDRQVTENPERMAHLGFTDSSIIFKDATGGQLWRLDIGKEPDSGNGRFIRFGDEPKAFFSGLHIWLDTDAKGWADAKLLTVKPEEIATVTIPFDAGPPFVASRVKKDAPWTTSMTPAGQQVSADKVSTLLTSLTGLKFTETVDTGDSAVAAAATHMRTLVLTTFDGKVVTLSLGRKPEEKKLKAPTVNAKDGLASLGNLTDSKGPATPATPQFDTIPAGPVFASIASSDPNAAVNAMMKKRAFEVDDYIFTGLPQKPDELFEPLKAK